MAALLVSRDVRSAATAAGVSERSLWRWLQDPQFTQELHQAESEAINTAARRLIGLSDLALNFLNDLLEDPTAAPGLRVRAADLVLTTLLKLREFAVLEARISELEAKVK